MTITYVLGISSNAREVDHAVAGPIFHDPASGMPWWGTLAVCGTSVVVMDYGNGPAPWLPTTTAFCEICRLLTGMGPQ
ncbi:hypothetical protein [Nonomuraea dietziae]|uniref:hypothetical protein n=1 Tax=Nonomuraea dietziae TaxID=65515 RepID=UPI0034152050